MEKQIPDINTRLLEAIEHLGLSFYKIAQKVPLITSSKLTHIKSGRNKVSIDIVKSFLETFPQFSNNWILTGEGQMLKSETSEVDTETLEKLAVAVIDNWDDLMKIKIFDLKVTTVAQKRAIEIIKEFNS